jgi:hypothetical protein
MNKEELIQFLKENLTIKLTTKEETDFYRGLVGYELNVEIHLGNEIISSSSDSIDIK